MKKKFFDYISKLTLSMNAKKSHQDKTDTGKLKIKPNYYSDYLFCSFTIKKINKKFG